MDGAIESRRKRGGVHLEICEYWGGGIISDLGGKLPKCSQGGVVELSWMRALFLLP